MGGRSRGAAQLLSGKGFKDIFNLKGGLKAWQGLTAEGPAEFGMFLLTGDETFDEIVILAYGMEEGMWIFYETIKENVEDASAKELLAQLAGIEDKHKEKLFSLYTSISKSEVNLDQFEAKIVSKVMESGMSTDEFIEQNRLAMQDIPGILNIAMTLEIQAFDLYSRYSQKATDKTTKDILYQIAHLYQIAQEEKAHLKSLGQLMDDHI
ncbi:MAG: sulfurtransferase [Deltaproteobacteria bacterium]|nr:sulfurtransferase [Deltaproteobacteria bacterium]